MINRYIRWGLLGAVPVGLTYTGTSVGLEKGDWADWVSAIGTVGTLLGTIWLATAETRRRESQERVIARLRGAGMVGRIESALNEIVVVVTLLELARNGDRQAADYAFCESKLAAIEFWTIDEVTQLAPLPCNTAIKLAETVGQVGAVQQTLHRMGLMRYLSPQFQRDQVKAMAAIPNTTLEYLEDARRECRFGSIEMQLGVH